MRIERLFIPGPAGRLEALLEYDSQPVTSTVALVCHPHPLYGGTMHTKAVFRAAKAALLEGVPTLRFNFRGVGQSAGEHGRGVGEQDDVRAALDFLSTRYRGAAIILMGFSFGSGIGLRVGAADARVAALVGLGLPVESYDFSYLRECSKPKLIVEGALDQYGPREKVQALFGTFAPPKKLYWVEGADHFFTGKLDEMQNAVQEFVRGIITAGPERPQPQIAEGRP